jgi:hypothetical protein
MEFTSVELVSGAELATSMETVMEGARSAATVERERRSREGSSYWCELPLETGET